MNITKQDHIKYLEGLRTELTKAAEHMHVARREMEGRPMVDPVFEKALAEETAETWQALGIARLRVKLMLENATRPVIKSPAEQAAEKIAADAAADTKAKRDKCSACTAQDCPWRLAPNGDEYPTMPATTWIIRD